MDGEIIELHPPLVTFASIDYDGDPAGPVQNNPPPPAPLDHKNLVVVNRNDLESILVKERQQQQQQQQREAAVNSSIQQATAAQIYHKQNQMQRQLPIHRVRLSLKNDQKTKLKNLIVFVSRCVLIQKTKD